MAEDGTILRGRRVGSRSGRRPSTYEEGRVCADRHCETRLSRYNHKRFCFNHAPVRYPRVRGRKPSRA